ncbi:MAG: hypothetical protein ABMB14_32305, partial [Myxococcota bacterium]
YTGGGGRPLVSFGGADDVLAVELLDLGAGVVVAMADPVYLWNGSFVHPDNERFVGDLVFVGQSVEGWALSVPPTVQLATWGSVASSSDGGAASNPLSSLARAGLLPFVLQALVCWTLVGLWRGWPFAPLRDPPDPGRRSFVEHVTALGTRYWRIGAAEHAGRAYASLWVARLGSEGLQLAAGRAGYTPDRARAWAAEIEGVASGAPVDPERLAKRMEELWIVTSGSR